MGNNDERYQLLSAPSLEIETIPVTCSISGTRRYVPVRRSGDLVGSSSSSRTSTRLLSRTMEEILAEVEPRMRFILDATDVEERKKMKSDGALWVDKYAPEKYTELLGCAKTNREVLKWLLDWRKCAQGILEAKPECCMILICGPPGIGKTTLARVLSRHAGFNAVDINASDLRSGKSLQQVVVDALSSRSIFSSHLPNCVILDEIDGALAGPDSMSASSCLLSVIKSNPCGPIIGVCNDAYANALRGLRKAVQVFNYKKPPREDLVTRLRGILEEEGFGDILSDYLDSVCDCSGGDIRAALNALQFLRIPERSATGRSSFELVRKILQKGSGSNIFAIWTMVFSVPKRLRFRSLRETSQHGLDALRQELELGDMDFILDGCFENYLAVVRGGDPKLKAAWRMVDYHSFQQLTHSLMNSGIANGLLESAVLVYRRHGMKLTRPHKFDLPREASLKKEHQELQKEMSLMAERLEHNPVVFRGIRRRDLALDVAPLLAHIVRPNAKESSREQYMVDLQSTLSFYGLKRIASHGGSDRGGLSARSSRFEPDIDLIAAFPLPDTSDQERPPFVLERPELSASVMDALILDARMGNVVSRRYPPVPMGRADEDRKRSREGQSEIPDSTFNANAVDALALATVPGTTETFPRVMAVYRYQEGHTNAVRRPLTIYDMT